MNLRRRKNIKIHSEGTGFLIGTFVLFFFLNSYLYYFLPQRLPFYVVSTICTILFLLVLNFFRSPLRRFPEDSYKKVISPADGRVVAIEEVYEPEVLKCYCIQVSVFMSIFNVHANWYPVDGTVSYVKHHSGKFLAAYLPKSSLENERSTVVIRTDCGKDILTRQIAGAVAKRIVTYSKVDTDCCVDEHLGFIKFGSRVDVYLPLDSEILVELGQSVVGNQTVIAQLT